MIHSSTNTTQPELRQTWQRNPNRVADDLTDLGRRSADTLAQAARQARIQDFGRLPWRNASGSCATRARFSLKDFSWLTTLEIALRVVGGAGDFNCSVDNPEHDKQRAENQNTSDESLDSATAFGRPVS